MASYEKFAEIIRYRFTNPQKTSEELFSRLTPAYDICPQGRSGNEASQAMLIVGNKNLSQLQTCLETAYNFNISEQKAKEIFNKQISIIQDNWNSICEEAELSEIDKKLLWHRQFLNPFSIAF
ncbi:hypothetical protein [Photorhabdus namnaonensis]|uniref:Uncharacterized protein n=1 Tax=Photorhabdus namnaonensis TaxID=1851568 RepID=A0A1B8YCE1_9GAMM|nr:hypothetical protein [Photorhabdus namnaonensis]OCA52821.1 hypothetical protein Phpb_03873 [Photorhabdus namnaonensis]